LDVYANEVFIQTLINREIVCGIASEENDDFITVEGAITVITTNMWSWIRLTALQILMLMFLLELYFQFIEELLNRNSSYS
jgi:hypothetical protein